MAQKFFEAVSTLEKLFDQFNEYLFNGELNRPVITIQADHTQGAYGWCTTQKIWKSEEEEYYEINICAEHLNRPINETCATLIHEMVHLDNLYKGIKDTSSNGRYHNKKYKETAEAHGLKIDKSPKYGWTITNLSDETIEFIKKNITIDKIDLARAKVIKRSATARKKTNCYMCPNCLTKFYTIHQINATCDDCGEKFEQYR